MSMYAIDSSNIDFRSSKTKNLQDSYMFKESFSRVVRIISIGNIDRSVEIKKFMTDRGFSIFSRNLLYDMAENSPHLLLYILQLEYVRPTLLTFVAEIAGKVVETRYIVPELLRLLNHEKAFVREGAIYGLAFHKNNRVYESLINRLNIENSESVKEVIYETIENADLWKEKT